MIRETVTSLADDISVNASGGLVCRIGSGGPKILIDAHMDEIGFMVHHIEKDGYARFSNIGGLFPITLYGNRVRFADGTIGTIGLDDWLHVSQLPKLTDYFIDFSTGAATSAHVQVGDVGTLWRDYAERGDRIVAKSLDDRIGCAVLIETMRCIAHGDKLPNELIFVFATEEEVGLYGARTTAFGVAPDLAIAVDVTSAGDMPKSERSNARLGYGASIKARDPGHIIPPAMKNLLVQRAETAQIPYQIEVSDLGTTDGAVIQQSRGGVPTGVVSIPCRYVHTTSETVDVHDVQACVDLLVATLTQPVDDVLRR